MQLNLSHWDFKNKILNNILNSAALCVVKLPQRLNLHNTSKLHSVWYNQLLTAWLLFWTHNINGHQQRSLRLTALYKQKSVLWAINILYRCTCPFSINGFATFVLWAKPTNSSCLPGRGETKWCHLGLTRKIFSL